MIDARRRTDLAVGLLLGLFFGVVLAAAIVGVAGREPPGADSAIANATRQQVNALNPQVRNHTQRLYGDYLSNLIQLRNFLSFYQCTYEYGTTDESAEEGYYWCPAPNATARPLSVYARFRWGD